MLDGYTCIVLLHLFQKEQMSGIVKSWLGIFNSYHYFKKSRCQVLSKADWVYSIPTTIARPVTAAKVTITKHSQVFSQARPRGFKTLSMLNSTEIEISTAYKN